MASGSSLRIAAAVSTVVDPPNVCNGAEELPGLGLESRGGRFSRQILFGELQLGEPEIEDLDPAVPCEIDIFGLQIAVNDVLFVRRRQTFGDGLRVFHGLGVGESSALDDIAQRGALEKLHHRVGDAVLGAEIVNREDIRVVQLRH
jgi:hypothetical protein